MRRVSIAVILSSILWLTACDKSKTVHIPPSALTDYPAQITWEKDWSMRVGKGDGEMYLQLQPVIPAITETKVFAADHKGRVTAIDATTKAERLWQTRLDAAAVTGGVGADLSHVYVGTIKGQVIALSQSDGQELWRTQLSSEILSAPQAQEGVVAALTEDSRVYGLDANSGEILWQYQHTAPLLQLRGSAPVIIDTQVVYAGFANGQVVALDLFAGTLLWQETVSYPRGRSEIDRIVDVNGRMAVLDGILYVVNYQGRAIAVDVRAQNLLWEKEFSSYAGLSVNQDAVFITDTQSDVWALNRHTGDTLWQQGELSYRRLTAPTVFENMIAVGDYEGYVHLLRAENGQLLGRVRADSHAIHTPPVAVGNSLFVLSSSGELVRLTPVPTL